MSIGAHLGKASTTDQIAAADHDGSLHTETDHSGNLFSDLRGDLRVDTGLTSSGKTFPAELQ